ncbi:MAG: methyl-accepting chemotaxis protein [Pseudomonadota bacterium]|nr:methyl-accepting chemotaxis protein [Pseudomonadota bacterium]
MSSTGGNFTQRLSGSMFTGLLALISLMLLIGNVGYRLFKDGQDRNAINLSNDLQVQSQSISRFATEAALGNFEAFEELKATRQAIDNNVKALLVGSPPNTKINPIPAYKGQVGGVLVDVALDKLAKAWDPISKAAATIQDSQDLVLDITETANDFQASIPRLTAKMEEIVSYLTERGAPAKQIYLATRQTLLADRMLRRVSEILKGGDLATSAADQFSRDAKAYGDVLNGLINGSAELGLQALTDPTARAILSDVQEVYNQIGQNVDKIQEASTQLFEVTEASGSISEVSSGLLEDSKNLSTRLNELGGKRLLGSNLVSIFLALFTLLFASLATFSQFLAQRRQLQTTADLNTRNQEAILRLLDEMGSLAEGDLTVKATVTEDITGAIADSVNFAVEALRSLVTTINETAVQVAAAAQETQATAMHLAEAAEHQAQQITSASAAINEIAVSIDEVSKNSAESADVAHRSVQIASKGAAIVRQTIQGMDNIRDQIQETSKRIKRLGESSQEIGSIVELINDIAEQTNILALNAAIQAASAGEAGRGFAVVADEVQRLAERASGATKRIETLVQTIQSDTNEAVSSMEQTTAEVVSGARLAEDAGLALGEIEKVSNDLADLIQNISEAARQQSAAATNISATMNVIQEITTQTSAGASQTAESIGNLAQLAADLRRSVADFKLPS